MARKLLLAFVVLVSTCDYVKVTVEVLFFKTRANLVVMPQEEGVKKLKDVHPSSWEIKK